MISIIIYITSDEHIEYTIESILNNTPQDLISEIIVCGDGVNCRNGVGNFAYLSDYPVEIINSDVVVGRAKLWNKAVKSANGNSFIFMNQDVRVSEDWIYPLVAGLDDDEGAILSPVVYDLDVDFWSSDGFPVGAYGWRWDLKLRPKPYNVNGSPSISSACIAIKKSRFDEIGGFDDKMKPGDGEDIEISLKNWLLGGKVKIVKDSEIAIKKSDVGNNNNTLYNLSRIAEVWLGKYASFYYESRDIKPADVDTGRLNNLVEIQEKQKKNFKWFLDNYQPELISVYDLKHTAHNKTIAIVAEGPSIDCIDPSTINKHDILIGVDHIGTVFKCDYVTTHISNIAVELMKSYKHDQILVPTVLSSYSDQQWVAESLSEDLIRFELDEMGVVPRKISPPFCNFGSAIHSAIHFASFLGPRQIFLYGMDNKFIGGKSHTSKIELYNNGNYWPDDENIQNKFRFYDHGVDQLSKLLLENKISLIRINHA
jgi:GT2 family glycosyltransferase